MIEEHMQPEPDLSSTLSILRMRKDLQSDIIEKMERYRRTLVTPGSDDDTSRGGFRNKYSAEIDYLEARRQALEALILSVERFGSAHARQQGRETAVRLR